MVNPFIVDHLLMLPVYCTFDGFVLKLFLHVNMCSKCSSNLYEAMQMKDKSYDSPFYILTASFYLLTEIKLSMIKFKTFLVYTQAWFTRTTLANPGCFNFFSSFIVFFPLAV